ncbi:MAG TPA: exodeoxyribonuclease V subunit alpha, partial [Capillimicrobium sp.]
PLRLEGSTLYLERLFGEERAVADDLRSLAGSPPERVDAAVLEEGLRRLFGDAPGGRQAQAAEAAVRRRLAVVAGGPGTGKTTTIARVAALLHEQAAAAGAPPPLVALAAPTGKAATRLEQAVREQAAGLPVGEDARAWLLGLQATTLHRLLGWRPSGAGRFRHHRGNRLPHDVVIVDETSMVSLSLMARLVEAVRDRARLVLVGDPAQLASVEAGAVLGDIVGAGDGEGIVVLERVHRFGEAIARVADAVRRGDAHGAVAALRADPERVTWIDADAAEAGAEALDPVRRGAVAAARAAVEAGRRGDAVAALEALTAFRLLCAHRRGPHGVALWSARVERWLADAVEGFEPGAEWYPGRPLLVTRNDYALRLSNGDVGVAVADADGRLTAAFERRGEVVRVAPGRLEAVETVHAMTVHKSQGSQFAAAAVVLPDPASPLLTRELLYTALTRAQQQLTVVGTEAALRAAIERPIARASGLGARLWR